MKILGHKKDEDGEAATVAFMDIKSANKAHSVEHKIEDRLLKTDYYDPSSFCAAPPIVDNCDRASPRPEDSGPGPGGGVAASASCSVSDFNENSRSSHNNNSNSERQQRSSSSRYEVDSFRQSSSSSRSSRSYRGGQSGFDSSR